MPSNNHEASLFGAFALVSYVPAPLGAFLDGLRQSLPGEGYAQSHITLAPPRPLRVPLETACQFAQQVLDRFSPFRVVLGDVHFFPETNLLYLDLLQGQDEIYALHEELNTGALAHEERFEFRPHLTIGGPMLETEIPAFQQRSSEVWLARDGEREFQVSEIVALWLDTASEGAEWTRVWTGALQSQRNAAANDRT